MSPRFTVHFSYGTQARYASAEYRVWDRQEGRTLPEVYIDSAQASAACRKANAEHEASSAEAKG